MDKEFIIHNPRYDDECTILATNHKEAALEYAHEFNEAYEYTLMDTYAVVSVDDGEKVINYKISVAEGMRYVAEESQHDNA